MTARGVVILGVGLCCALERSFKGCAAAYAAGQRNFRRVASVTGEDGKPSTIGEVIDYEKVRDYPERLRRLCEIAAADLAATAPIPSQVTMRIMLQGWMEQSPFASQIRDDIAAGGRETAARGEFFYGGPAEALRLIAKAAREISDGKADAMIVGAIDSFLHAELLDSLTLQRRIFSSQNPYAGFPGEAACFLLLGTDEAGHGRTALGTILGSIHGEENENVVAPKGVVGRGLAFVYQGVAEHITPHRLISDLSGERWRAEELGFACSAAGQGFAELAANVEAPALYVGDCGAAMGPLMTAFALGDPPRGVKRPTGPVAMISASSRNGPRAALVIQRHVSAPTTEPRE